ncbi:hypothetical protein PSECIP111951_03826 [Pseudoalteromonas holothuriae]|uniref:YecA family protein n=1 Tax=Pseudoalteromonas holothuriae TaxID=2963714 RepID=A0A9W4R3H3_9GAMM|nr:MULTISPECIES: YecA family protein [unclassified Pseudoalteromonas]CAH9066498.1 hypothetical protein PSECIP111854_03902 [Pseudoalteromonas sp. CIP111854]CAH9067551.1 hypothetical protein PSECIP111951_03826 [Pseudoalteromonas sp. CIP111951]
MLEFNFTPQHRQQLNEYIALRDSAMPLSAVQGYLFALICGPDATEVEQWLAQVSGNDLAMDETIVFSYMALHHQISEQVFSGCYQLPCSGEVDYGDRHLWSVGFVHGTSSYFEPLLTSNKVSSEFKEALQMATEQLAFFSLEHEQVAAYCASHDCDEALFVHQQGELAQEFAQGYAQLIETVALESGLYDEEEGF